MTHETFTVRVPEAWSGQISSRLVRGWLADFRRQPRPLAPDPGPGSTRLSLAVPRWSIAAAASGLRLSESEFLRRLIAANLPGATTAIGEKPSGALRWVWGGLATVLALLLLQRQTPGNS